MAATAYGHETLFDPAIDTDTIELLGQDVCRITGVSYRQLDYWTTTGLISASAKAAQGSGSRRLYTYRDVLEVKIIVALLHSGLSLQTARTTLPRLRKVTTDKLLSATIASDGKTVSVCSTPQQINAQLASAPGLFFLSVPALVNGLNAECAAAA